MLVSKRCVRETGGVDPKAIFRTREFVVGLQANHPQVAACADMPGFCRNEGKTREGPASYSNPKPSDGEGPI